MSRRRAFRALNRGVAALPFISTWRTTNTLTGSSSSNQIRLPLFSGGTYDFNVNWGDGNIDLNVIFGDSRLTHTYSVAGDYTITITGIFIGGIFLGGGAERLKIINISQWGIFQPLNQTNINQGYFMNCTQLNVTATDVPILTGATALTSFFRGCTSLTSPASIGTWDLSGVINISAMFLGATNFNSDISGWNVSLVQNFFATFQSATQFNRDIGGWDVSSSTNMSQLFQAATQFNQNIGSWNVSNVTNFSGFMNSKTSANYSAANLDAIYNGWSSRPVVASITISFNTIKYTAAGSAGRSILTGAPNNWTITDGGI